MKMNLLKFPWKNIDIIVTGLCNMLDGSLCILSLGFWLPSFQMKYVVWRSRKLVRPMLRAVKKMPN